MVWNLTIPKTCRPPPTRGSGENRPRRCQLHGERRRQKDGRKATSARLATTMSKARLIAGVRPSEVGWRFDTSRIALIPNRSPRTIAESSWSETAIPSSRPQPAPAAIRRTGCPTVRQGNSSTASRTAAAASVLRLPSNGIRVRFRRVPTWLDIDGADDELFPAFSEGCCDRSAHRPVPTMSVRIATSSVASPARRREYPSAEAQWKARAPLASFRLDERAIAFECQAGQRAFPIGTTICRHCQNAGGCDSHNDDLQIEVTCVEVLDTT